MILEHTNSDNIYQVNQRVSFRAKLTNRLLRLFVKDRLDEGFSISTLRKFVAKLDPLIAKTVKGIPIKDCDANGVACRWVSAPSETSKVLLYLHGSGFAIHLPHAYDGFVANMCQQMGVNALIPNYRLAPEHPYPAAVDDCYSCYKWLLEQGYKAQNIVIAGDSAGGCLTLTTLLQARDQQLELPAAAVLMSPGVDIFHADKAVENESSDPMLSATILAQFLEGYLPKEFSNNDPLLSPILADFNNLPPMDFHVGSTEVLLDHTVCAVEKAKRAGGDVKLSIWKDMPHVHPLMHWLPESKQAVNLITDFLTTHLVQVSQK